MKIALLATLLIFGAGRTEAEPSCGLGPQFATARVVSSAAAPVPEWSCMAAPTLVSATVLRPDAGVFAGPRSNGGRHLGVDLMLRQYQNQCLASTSSIPAKSFEVYAVANGTVAYARANNAEACPADRPDCALGTTGLGLTVILDHGNGLYSLYAHMAQDPATNRCLPPFLLRDGASMRVHIGQKVKAGEIIGFLGALAPGLSELDRPTGNAAATSQSVQLHFEFFRAPAGRSSSSAIAQIVPAAQRGKIDPTSFLGKFYAPHP